MFAVVEVASKQYKVKNGDIIDIPLRLPKNELVLDKVLLTVAGKDVNIGQPYLKDAKVTCNVLGETKGKKITAFKFKKGGYHSNIGHRDKLTRVEIKKISA